MLVVVNVGGGDVKRENKQADMVGSDLKLVLQGR
jgi:hypothetical protein